LDQAVDMGWVVYRAEKSQHWPGTASLEVALVWTGHPGNQELRILDARQVKHITTSLDAQSRVSGKPHTLVANAGQSFEGCKPLGMGYVLELEEVQELLAKDPRNKEVLFPYLNGEDLNSRWDCSASRWVIDFNDWSIERAKQYSEVFAIVDTKVRPERQRRKPNGEYVLRRPLPQRWWQYADRRPALRQAIANLDRVLVVVLVSKYFTPVFVSRNQVFAHKLAVFPYDRAAYLALLTSAPNQHWAMARSSTLETRLNYSPSDAFDTLAQPNLTEWMDQVAQKLESLRRGMMRARKIGLTNLYNLVHDESVRDDDIVELRNIHTEIDEAVRDAYAADEEAEPEIREFERTIGSATLPTWREIVLGHGFHQVPPGMRFTVSPQARVDLLDKLLALNHYRYRQEVEWGRRSGKGRGASKKQAAAPASAAAGMFDDGALFRPEGTMF
jgi:hypothetical protein